MKVYLNKITGIEEALTALLMSKKSWTREKELTIMKRVRTSLTEEGFLKKEDEEIKEDIDKLIKYGILYGHTTLLRFIDVSYTVEGLHRAAQDDFDSHAKRLDNRIVRSSTRLARFSENEVSDYYREKIMFPTQVCEQLGISLPESLEMPDGRIFEKVPYGYIDKEYIGTKEENDVRRGLYPQSIASNFLFKVQYPEFAHIVQHRDKTSTANPELIAMIESAKQQLCDKFEPLGKNLTKVKMQNYRD